VLASAGFARQCPAAQTDAAESAEQSEFERHGTSHTFFGSAAAQSGCASAAEMQLA
jgi:hypothetical protein